VRLGQNDSAPSWLHGLVSHGIVLSGRLLVDRSRSWWIVGGGEGSVKERDVDVFIKIGQGVGRGVTEVKPANCG